MLSQHPIPVFRLPNHPSMLKSNQPQRRKRGVILNSRGWQRLRAAEQQVAVQHNSGKPYTLEQLSQRTGLSPNTITKVRQRRLTVDRQTLEVYFNALGLHLNPDDFVSVDPDTTAQTRLRSPLKGQVPLDSPFYIERPPAEQVAYEEILQPGALIRIRAPHQGGKTSLMARTLAWARTKGFQTAVLNLQLADVTVLTDFDRFLRWFAAVTTRSLQMSHNLNDCWDDLLGSSYNCTHYFERCLLQEMDAPLVLALDDTDVLFNHPEIAAGFFGMLRAWYENARYGSSSSSIWQRLRLLIVYSSEAHVPLNVNQSPFDVGALIELPNFNYDQVQDLAQRYEVFAVEECATQLLELLGGNPYLTQTALHYISTQSISLDQLAEMAIAPDGVFSAHLRQQYNYIQPYPDLMKALKQVTTAIEPIPLNPVQAFRLQSLGLVHLFNLEATVSCKLYHQFFEQVFRSA